MTHVKRRGDNLTEGVHDRDRAFSLRYVDSYCVQLISPICCFCAMAYIFLLIADSICWVTRTPTVSRYWFNLPKPNAAIRGWLTVSSTDILVQRRWSGHLLLLFWLSGYGGKVEHPGRLFLTAQIETAALNTFLLIELRFITLIWKTTTALNSGYGQRPMSRSILPPVLKRVSIVGPFALCY